MPQFRFQLRTLSSLTDHNAQALGTDEGFWPADEVRPDEGIRTNDELWTDYCQRRPVGPDEGLRTNDALRTNEGFWTANALRPDEEGLTARARLRSLTASVSPSIPPYICW